LAAASASAALFDVASAVPVRYPTMRRSAWMPGAASVSAAGTAASRSGASWATATEAVPTESRAAETAAADISFRRREGEVR